MTLPDSLRAVYRTSTPLVHISTPDPAATIATAVKTITAAAEALKETPPAFLRWSIVTGIRPLDAASQALADQINATNLEQPDMVTGSPVDALAAFGRAIKTTPAYLFALQMDECWKDPAAVQACWELRDPCKAAGACLIGLSPGATLPPALQNDVLDLDEPLPDAAELAEIVRETCANLEGFTLTDEQLAASVEALTGLAAYPADQAVSLCLSKEQIDVPELWERKRRMIDQTPALSVYRGREMFADLGGNDNIKAFLGKILAGKRKPGAIVIIDEIEKALAASGSDSSGTSQDQLGALLREMQDTEATGILCLGPPGTGKTAAAKAAGNEARIPALMLDLGAAKASLVGQSEQRTRAALKVIRAVSNGLPLYIATCNSINALPPELRRRFHLGTFFFDLPNAEERRSIWSIYIERYGLSTETDSSAGEPPIPPDEGWTGAEIKNCCDIADRLAISLEEAAGYIVPVSTSAQDVIETLRRSAAGRFTSANAPGVYQYSALSAAPGLRERKIRAV